MFRKLLDSFSATHVTILALGAMFVPGALYAIPSFTNVAVLDPNTGSFAYVDTARRLYTFDPIAGYRNNPANYVDIQVSNHGYQCETSYSYTVPAGKALIVTSISGYEQQYTANANFSGFYLYEGSACNGKLLASHISSVSSTAAFSPVTMDFGAGIALPAGSVLSVYSDYNLGYEHIHGYLVPATAVPVMTSAAYQGKSVTAEEVAAKRKR